MVCTCMGRMLCSVCGVVGIQIYCVELSMCVMYVHETCVQCGYVNGYTVCGYGVCMCVRVCVSV